MATGGASVAATNSTSFGHPEISDFYTNYFKPAIGGADPLNGEVFSPDWAMDVMAYKTDGTYTVETNALLNVGNLGYLFSVGK